MAKNRGGRGTMAEQLETVAEQINSPMGAMAELPNVFEMDEPTDVIETPETPEVTEPIETPEAAKSSQVYQKNGEPINQYPPAGKGWECEAGDFASDGGLLLARRWMGGTHCIDLWKLKKGSMQVVKSTSDVKGSVIHSKLVDLKEALRLWEAEIRGYGAKAGTKGVVSTEPTIGGKPIVRCGNVRMDPNVTTSTHPKIPAWGVQHLQDKAEKLMLTPVGLLVGPREDLLKLREIWVAYYGPVVLPV